MTAASLTARTLHIPASRRNLLPEGFLWTTTSSCLCPGMWEAAQAIVLNSSETKLTPDRLMN